MFNFNVTISHHTQTSLRFRGISTLPFSVLCIGGQVYLKGDMNICNTSYILGWHLLWYLFRAWRTQVSVGAVKYGSSSLKTDGLRRQSPLSRYKPRIICRRSTCINLRLSLRGFSFALGHTYLQILHTFLIRPTFTPDLCEKDSLTDWLCTWYLFGGNMLRNNLVGFLDTFIVFLVFCLNDISQFFLTDWLTAWLIEWVLHSSRWWLFTYFP